jgi:hypothetical protein
MHFHERTTGAHEPIEQRDAGVRIPACVHDEPIDRRSGFLDEVDQLARASERE